MLTAVGPSPEASGQASAIDDVYGARAWNWASATNLPFQPTAGEIVGARSWFGDIVLILFLLAQVLDGTFTYLGVLTFGRSIEANPLLAWLIGAIGEGPAVTSAKLVAGSCGIALHLTAVHRIVALLTVFYLTVAVLPWATILFF